MKIGMSAMVSVAAICGIAGLAQADTVEMRFVSSGHARQVHVRGVADVNVNAGELIHEFRNGTGGASGLSGQIATFCTEVTQLVNSSWRTYTMVNTGDAPMPGSGMGETKATMLAHLYSVANGQQHTSSNFAAAFQMMIWEIVYDFDEAALDGNLSRTEGNIRFTGGDSHFGTVSAIFNDLRTSLMSINGMPTAELRALVNGGSQDQLITIPLPSVGAMAGLGLLGVMGTRRRREN